MNAVVERLVATMADNGSVADRTVVREGVLLIKDSRKQSWASKFLLLDDHCLCFGKSQDDCVKGKHDQFIGKHDRLEVEKADLEVGKHVFVLRTHQKSGGKENKILLAASNDDERDKWIQCIKAFSAYYLDEKFERKSKVASIVRTETSGSKDSGYNSRSSKRFSDCTNFEYPITYSSQQTSPERISTIPWGEQEEGDDKEELKTNSEIGKQVVKLRRSSKVLTRRPAPPTSVQKHMISTSVESTVTCPKCKTEFEAQFNVTVTSRTPSIESTRKPTQHDSRNGGCQRYPKENVDDTLEQ